MKRLLSLLAPFILLFAGAASAGETTATTFHDPQHILEIGGREAGLEFHRGRALPSRISWYSPVANSIDIAQDYWTRDTSLVLTVHLDGETLGLDTKSVTWLPSRADFALPGGGRISYSTSDTLPVVVLKLTPAPDWAGKTVTVSTIAQLRSSHSYKTFNPEVVSSEAGGAWSEFPFDDTGFSRLSLVYAGHGEPGVGEARAATLGGLTWLEASAVVQGEQPLVFLLTVSKLSDSLRTNWLPRDEALADAALYERRVQEAMARKTVEGWPGDFLAHGLRWSQAVMLANRHSLGGLVLPMPCPAQYNFFFTHDMLVTHLGTVRFDAGTVRHDLRALLEISQGSPVLPHAWYWKDDHYEVEWSGPDNWNHLWFLLLSGAYRRHTADRETLLQLAPMIDASLHTVAGHINGDTLMVAASPDWWDIGDAEGARPYLTALAARALEEGVETLRWVGSGAGDSRELLETASGLRRNITKLWNDSTGYLHDWIGDERDPHYYTGALVAVWTGALDRQRSAQLVATAETVLLDPEIGVRNAMPPDFHTLNKKYGFLEGEVGEPGLYANAGIWPQGNAWLALAQARLRRLDDALETITRYMTPLGVQASPGGQPSFYEYRMSDQSSDRYGRVDKPTFLWSGGWLVSAAYRIAGLLDSPWNLSLDPNLPSGVDTLRLHVVRPDGITTVERVGRGKTFRRLIADGTEVHSAVLLGSPSMLVAEAGAPESPCLASASAEVLAVEFNRGRLEIALAGLPGRVIELAVDAPIPPSEVTVEGGKLLSKRASLSVAGRYHCEVLGNTDSPVVRFAF